MPSNMKLNAVIERGQDGGFAICVREMPWLLGYGKTESEAREDFNDVFKEQETREISRLEKCRNIVYIRFDSILSCISLYQRL